MGQQTNKIQKRRRRKAYLIRKKTKAPVKEKPKAKAPAKKAAAAPAPAAVPAAAADPGAPAAN